MGASPASPGGGVYHSHFRTRMACATPRKKQLLLEATTTGSSQDGRRAAPQDFRLAATPCSSEAAAHHGYALHRGEGGFSCSQPEPFSSWSGYDIGDTFLFRSRGASPCVGADRTRVESWGPEVRAPSLAYDKSRGVLWLVHASSCFRLKGASSPRGPLKASAQVGLRPKT